jgi:hypothetical protein
MADDNERDEYVENDTGKIYTGNARQIFGRPWKFGQVRGHMLVVQQGWRLANILCLAEGLQFFNNMVVVIETRPTKNYISCKYRVI